MPDDTVSPIKTLPAEILHRIFDDLDAETIIISVRPVSRLFRSIVNTYDRYDLNLKLISKTNFYLLCRLIHPRNVISLTLSNQHPTSNQIELFSSLVHLQLFTRLHSLTLLHIDEDQLNSILKQVHLNSLISFSFSIRKYDDRRRKTTLSLLSSTIGQSTLRRLNVDKKTEKIPKIVWPINCTIHHLTINNFINIDELSTIFQSSPHLHNLILKEIPTGAIKLTSTGFPQLTSLIIKNLFVTIDKLEPFLLLTPSLIYLKLIRGNMLGGKRWEEFIKENLLQLNKFEFYFEEWDMIDKTVADLELIIASFQTPFWIEDKQWFVNCEYQMVHINKIFIYSMPICESDIQVDYVIFNSFV